MVKSSELVALVVKRKALAQLDIDDQWSKVVCSGSISCSASCSSWIHVPSVCPFPFFFDAQVVPVIWFSSFLAHEKQAHVESGAFGSCEVRVWFAWLCALCLTLLAQLAAGVTVVEPDNNVWVCRDVCACLS